MMSTFDPQMEPSKFTRSCAKEIAVLWNVLFFVLIHSHCEICAQNHGYSILVSIYLSNL
jgi:hypothetical protein